MRSNLCRSSTTSIYMLSVTDFDPKGTTSKVRVYTGATFGHTGCWYSSLVFTPYGALLLGVPLSFALRLAQHLGVLSTVALAGGYRQVAGGRWYWSHESGATQAEINIHLSMMSALSIYTVLMRTNSPKQPGCLQFILDADQSPNADSPRSSRDQLITIVKLKRNGKRISKMEMCQKNWWKRYRLRMQGCLCESRKREVGEDMFTRGGGGGGGAKRPWEHPACTDLLCWSCEGRGCPIIIWWAPRHTAWRGNKLPWVCWINDHRMRLIYNRDLDEIDTNRVELLFPWCFEVLLHRQKGLSVTWDALVGRTFNKLCYHGHAQ